MAPTVITVTGSWKDPEGNDATGRVYFTLAAPILDSSGDLIVAGQRRSAILSSGAISIDLYATDEPGTEPAGNTYLVQEILDGVPAANQRTYSVEIPYDAASSTIDLADIAPASSTSVTYGVPLTGATMTGELSVPSLKVTGVTGATTDIGLVGGTSSGAPASGTFEVGDMVTAVDGEVWICTVAGTPGTWVKAGSGSYISFPTALQVPIWAYRSAVGTWTVASSGSATLVGHLDGPGTINSEISWDVPMQAGTWTLRLNGGSGGTSGILKFQIDGSTVGTIDQYSASSSTHVGEIVDIVVATTGVKTLRLVVDAKNASSSAYDARLGALAMIRTAA